MMKTVIRYTLEEDVKYPKNLHGLHRDSYPKQ